MYDNINKQSACILLGICMHQGQSKWILASYSWFYASIPLILLFWFTSMSLHFSLYFPLFYFQLFLHLFATRHFTFASASRLRACTDISVGADSLATRQVFASARRDSFASAISTRLHPLDAGLSDTFPCVVGGVETRAAYDLIGKSCPGTRYMRGAQYSFLLLSAWPPLRRWALVHF